MAECSHNCANCSSKCSEIEFLSLHEGSSVKHIIGVVSGKGGVGKSMVTSLIATKMANQGYKVGVLDADITGPSIPKAFGVSGLLDGDDSGIFPAEAKNGIKMVSVNLLVEDPTRPVVFRGPALSGLVGQFYSDVKWGDLDYLFIDMPPGTADVTLTIFQQIPLSGLIMVSTPQDLVKLIVEKSLNMAKQLNVKVYGLVENMSYFVCPDCGKNHYIFGESHAQDICNDFHIPLLAQIPMNKELRDLVDKGEIYKYDSDTLDYLAASLM